MLIFSHFFYLSGKFISLWLFELLMNLFVDIHTHLPNPHSIGLCNYRMGIDTILPQGPFSAGIHPWDVDKTDNTNELLVELEQLNCDAIGEIGLDFACDADHTMQHTLFEQQLTIASRRNLPVILHSVKSVHQVIATLAHHPLRAAIFHGFIGSVEQMHTIISQGYYLSFGFGLLRSPRTIEALKECPVANLFLETDTSSEPIARLYNEVAILRNTTTEQLRTEIFSNYIKIFK